MSQALPTRRRWYQFGLGTLFLVVTAVVLVSYWLARPTILVHRFLAAIAAHDYAKAEGLFVEDTERLVFPGGFGNADQIQNAIIRVDPLTLREVISRERRIFIDVPYGKGMAEFDWEISVLATPQGLRIVYYAT